MAAKCTKPPWRYRLVAVALRPLLLLHSTWLALRGAGWRYFRQRLGWGYPNLEGVLWWHCASVGELHTAWPLLQRFRHLPILVSSNTLGAYLALRRRDPNLLHIYLPWDYPAAIRRLLQHIRPLAVLVMETELWPYFYAACARSGTPPLLLNGRLSRRSMRWQWWRPVSRWTLSHTALVAARSAADRERFITLGLASERSVTVDSLKYAVLETAAAAPPSWLGSVDDYFLAASTHRDEDLMLATLWHQIGDRLLIIVPRYPARGKRLQRLLQRQGIAAACYSSGALPGGRIYIADSIGDLGGLLAAASLVFIGGSFGRRGGQTPLEAVAQGKPLLCGPDMRNFAQETDWLRRGRALLQVRDSKHLHHVLAGMLARPALLGAMSRRCRALAAQRPSVLAPYEALLRRFLARSEQ